MEALLAYNSSDSENEEYGPAKRRKVVQPCSHARSCSENGVAAAAEGSEAAATAAGSQQPTNSCAGVQEALHAAAAEPPRVRRFPHVDGNWPAITYVAVSDPACLQALQSLAAALLKQQPPAAVAAADGCARERAGDTALPQLWPVIPLPTAATSHNDCSTTTQANAGDHHQQQPPQPPPQQQHTPAEQQQPQQQQQPPHLSLSRTVAIRHIQAASLRAALAKQLRPLRNCVARLSGLTCLVNENSSRTFVGIRVESGLKQVLRLVEAVDRAYALHGLPTFYQDPLPHISLAWAPGDCSQQLQPWLEGFPHSPIILRVQQIMCQVGSVKEVVWQGL